MNRKNPSYYSSKSAKVVFRQRLRLQDNDRNIKCNPSENIQYYLLFTQWGNGLESRSVLQWNHKSFAYIIYDGE